MSLRIIQETRRGQKAINGEQTRLRGQELGMSSAETEKLIGKFTLSEPEDCKSDTEPSAVIPIVAKRRDSKDSDTSISTDSASITLNGEPPDTLKPPLRRHSSIFTEELPENVEFEFLRHGWANRIVADKDGKPIYFANIPWQWTGTKLDIYRGVPDHEKSIASLSRKSLNKRIFYDLQEEVERFEIVGSKMYLGFDYHFDYNGRQYRWREKFWKFKCNSHEILTDTQTKEVIARFKNVSPLEVWRKKRYGKLVIYDEVWKTDDKLIDIIVMTLVAVKQRIREKKRMRSLWKLVAAAADGAGGN